MKGIPLHVLPLNDIQEHEESIACHCHPEVRTHDKDTGEEFGCWLVIHNAFDGREWNEMANH